MNQLARYTLERKVLRPQPALVEVRRAVSSRRERARIARKERARHQRGSRQDQLSLQQSNQETSSPAVVQSVPPISTYNPPPHAQSPRTFAQTLIGYAGLGVGMSLGMTFVGVAFKLLGF